MVPSIERSFLLAPSNDLESRTIHQIAQEKGLDAFEHAGSWGARLTLDDVQKHQHLWHNKKHLIIVELPGMEAEAALREQGYKLHIIDHHKYSDLDRSSGQSSIEQFCSLFDFSMSRYHQLVAHNDCDFIEGMRRAGATYQEMLEIRKADRMAQGNPSEPRTYDFPHIKLKDLDLWLAPLNEASAGLAEKIQTPSEQEYKKLDGFETVSCLIIYHSVRVDEQPLDCVEKVEFYGQAQQRPLIDAIVGNPVWQHGFKLWAGGGRYGAFMGAQVTQMHTASDVDGLINAMLDAFLVTGKPLLDYNCTFYLPLDPMLDSEVSKKKQKLQVVESNDVKRVKLDPNTAYFDEYDKGKKETSQMRLKQASDYMHTRVKEQMFEEHQTNNTCNVSNATKHFCLHDQHICCASLAILGKEGKETAAADVEDVSLYQFHNELVVLALRVRMPAGLQLQPNEKKDAHGKRWWRLLFANYPGNKEVWKKRQIDYWLRYTKMSRILYASFFEQLTEKKIEQLRWNSNGEARYKYKVRDSFNTIIIELLQLFYPHIPKGEWARDQRLRFIDSDNMHVNVVYSVMGAACPPQNPAYPNTQRLFSLALYVDEGSDMPYDQGFISKLLEKHQYNRWNDTGTHMGFCPYSAAFLGYGEYFHHPLSACHVPYIYHRMIVEALHYKNSLSYFDRRITLATKDLVARKEYSNHFRQLRGEFIAFTNRYWVKQLTPQIQGAEIYRHIADSLELETGYSHIKDQMERADEYSSVLRDRHFGLIALFIALLSLLGTFAAVTWLNSLTWSWSSWCESGCLGLGPRQFLWLAVVVLVAIIIVVKLFYPINSRLKCCLDWLKSKTKSMGLWCKNLIARKEEKDNEQ